MDFWRERLDFPDYTQAIIYDIYPLVSDTEYRGPIRSEYSE